MWAYKCSNLSSIWRILYLTKLHFTTMCKTTKKRENRKTRKLFKSVQEEIIIYDFNASVSDAAAVHAYVNHDLEVDRRRLLKEVDGRNSIWSAHLSTFDCSVCCDGAAAGARCRLLRRGVVRETDSNRISRCRSRVDTNVATCAPLQSEAGKIENAGPEVCFTFYSPRKVGIDNK